ncbi:MAG: hypothetical protein KAU28_06250 [Phycisphaerae bacterium]|nr:hypothetical protein [Phycisphaerae bacterium]
MNINDEQYERVARYLDGRKVSLNRQEQAIAEDIRRDERFAGALFDVQVPDETMNCVRRRVIAELLRPRRWLRVAGYVLVATAAAAAVLLAVAVLWDSPPRQDSQPLAEIPDRVIFSHTASDHDLELLDEQIAELEANFAFSLPPELLDLEVDELQRELEDFWLNGSLDRVPEG